MKFRAWHTKQEKFLFGYDYPNLGGFHLLGETVLCGALNSIPLDDLLHNVIITQFTGLKDKNEKDVYADDYLRDEKGIIFRVYAVIGGFAIKESVWKENLNDYVATDDLITTPLADAQTISYIHGSCEVIGNVYKKIQN